MLNSVHHPRAMPELCPNYARNLIDGIWLSDNVMTMSNHDHDDDEKITNYHYHLHIRDTQTFDVWSAFISGLKREIVFLFFNYLK